jgi:hypothetical protein
MICVNVIDQLAFVMDKRYVFFEVKTKLLTFNLLSFPPLSFVQFKCSLNVQQTPIIESSK